MMKIFLIVFYLFLGNAFAAVELGKEAPDFKLLGDDGKEHKLSDFKGKFIVLEWFNKGCPFVRKHYDTKNMQNLQKKYASKGVIWLSIISSAPGKQGYMNIGEATMSKVVEESAPTRILLDPNGKVGRTYEAKTTPQMFIINKKGLISYMGAIDDRISFEKADVIAAKNYVDLALSSLLKGEKVKIAKTQPYGCSVKY